jgi:hypothetical protein
MNNNKNILELYKNYLHSIQIREEFEDKYGDTEELIKMYEYELKEYSIKLIKK